MSVNSVGMSLGRDDSLRLWANRSEDWACLTINGAAQCEIRMDRTHVEALHEHVVDVLAGMRRWPADEDACTQAGIARKRAANTAAEARDLAETADAAGAHELAESLRTAAAEATGKAAVVDAAVRAFDNAAADADHAAEGLIYLTQQAEITLR